MKKNIRPIFKDIFVFLSVAALVLCALGIYYYGGRLDNKKTRFIAHRGLSSVYYENSAKAFEAAAKSDFFYGIETDIWQTKDGFFVCAHDKNPFSDSLVNIDALTLDEALILPLKNTAYRIVTLEQYLDICFAYGKYAVIELKLALDSGSAASLIELVEQKNMLGSSKFISFNKENIYLIKSLSPQADVEILYSTLSDMDFSFNMGIRFVFINPKLIKVAHKKGLKIGAWTVNNRIAAKELVRLKVDFITTDKVF